MADETKIEKRVVVHTNLAGLSIMTHAIGIYGAIIAGDTTTQIRLTLDIMSGHTGANADEYNGLVEHLNKLATKVAEGEGFPFCMHCGKYHAPTAYHET